MTNLFKFFVAVLMAMSIGIVSAAGWQQDNSYRYSFATKKKTLADGSVVEQRWKYTFINGKLRAKDKISESVQAVPQPAVTYSYSTKIKTLNDGSVVSEKWIYTKTDGKLTSKDLETTTVITPAPAVVEPVVTYSYSTKTKTLEDGSVVEQRWKFTKTDGKLNWPKTL
jgi:major membrane immunogen (membrane-anchored lipoprotein)